MIRATAIGFSLAAASAVVAPAASGADVALLTGPSSQAPERIALDYYDAGDQHLKLVARSVSPDGITHLRFNQVLDGIESADAGLQAHVTRDGRLITGTDTVVRGAKLRDTTPAIGALAGLGEARRVTGGLMLPPSVSKRSRAAVDFATGEAAKLRWTARAGGPRLAWDVITQGADDELFGVLVDADSGDTLAQRDLTAHLGQARYFPLSPDTTPATQITMPPDWYDQHAGGTRLWGQYARTYTDPQKENPAPGSEQGGARVQIPASGGAPDSPDWLYTRSSAFPGAGPCPSSGCSWNHADPATRTTNQFQVGAHVHVLTSRYLEYLARPPIGFDEASGTFRRTNVSGAGLGNDYVQAEINDGDGFNNANFSAPPDGTAPRMQMFFANGPDVNFGDMADVVYHEIGHGLSSRLVIDAAGNSGVQGVQAGMMGEGWSDFFAVDLLVHDGWMTDTAASGELAMGTHLATDGIRNKPMDCPVDPAGSAGCNRHATAKTVLGGYTYGDLGDMAGESHNGGEFWAGVLWDLRAAVGRDAGLALIAGGMRMTPVSPTMLDARDAILRQALAMRSAVGAPDDRYAAVWEVFRTRGLGYDARTRGPDDKAPVESYTVPRNDLVMRDLVVTDPYPGGDNDGRPEAGEELRVAASVFTAGLTDLVDAVTGVLTSASPDVAILDGTAAWPLLGRGRDVPNADPLVARMPASCAASQPLTVRVSSPDGSSSRTTTLSLRSSSRKAVPILDPPEGETRTTEATFEVVGGGTITDVDARIGELRHTWPGELKIELVHAGETVVLFEPDDRLTFSDLIDVTFDSDSARPTVISGDMTGTMRPHDGAGLDRFDGQPAAGTWRLRITDRAANDTGVLREWGVWGPEFPCPRLEIPAATTDAATDLGPNGATVGGAVDPNGRATGLRFAWGTTSAYGRTTPTVDVGAADDDVHLTAPVTGLAPKTTYHYRVEAIREGGAVAVAGEDRTFTTSEAPEPPPAPTPEPTTTSDTLPTPQPAASPAPTASPSPATAGPAPGADRAAPAFSSGPKVQLAKAGKRRRATFSFALSEPAQVQAVVTLATTGLRKGTRCVAMPKRKPKGARSCTREVAAARGTATTTRPGAGTLALPAKGLGKGRYTAVLTAIDSAGNRSSATVRFTIR